MSAEHALNIDFVNEARTRRAVAVELNAESARALVNTILGVSASRSGRLYRINSAEIAETLTVADIKESVVSVQRFKLRSKW